MAHGERAAKLGNASSDYGGKRPVNKGWSKGRSRRAHKASGGPSVKTTTHRVERRAAKRSVRQEAKP